MSTPSIETQLLAAHDEHADALFRFCYAFTGNRERAKDAVQETFVRIWSYLSRGKDIQQMKPFLYRTARNLLTDLSRRPVLASLEAMQEGGYDAIDEQMLDPATAAEAQRAIRLAASLDERYRDAVLLRYVEGMTPREIAAITKESENAVSVRIHRGLRQLRALMPDTKP